MKKKCARAAVLFAAFMLVLAPQAHAGLGDEVNSTDGGIMFHAGVGGGMSMFGVLQETSDNADLGTGDSTGVDLGMLLNYKMFAFGVNYTAVSFTTMEWEEEVAGVKGDYETKGGGGFSTLDATFGVKTFTEPGDMGFTHFYAGLRFWGAKRDYDYKKLNGVKLPNSDQEWDVKGRGYIFGFRDFSTLPLGPLSLAMQTALWYAHAPVTDLKLDGNGLDIDEDQTAGLGLELGAGVAFEGIGLSVIGGLKMDITGSSFETEAFPGLDNLVGAGYAQFFLVLKKEFAI